MCSMCVVCVVCVVCVCEMYLSNLGVNAFAVASDLVADFSGPVQDREVDAD